MASRIPPGVRAAALAASLSCGGLAAALPLYTVTDLGRGTFGYAINDAGQVTGISDVSAAFVYTPGIGVTQIGTLDGFDWATGFGINEAGAVAGTANTPSTFRAFRWHAGTGIVDLGAGFFSTAMDINNNGQITGAARFGSVPLKAYVHSPASGLVNLGTLGGIESFGSSINDHGQVTGSSNTGTATVNGPQHAFLYTPGAGMVDLGALGGYFSAGVAINNAGQVTGSWRAADPTEVFDPEGGASTDGIQVNAFVYTSGAGMVDIGTLRDGDATGFGIDSAGNVVGDVFYQEAGARPYPNFAIAFYYSPETGMLDLQSQLVAADRANWTLNGARAINDRGQIVAFGYPTTDFDSAAVRALLLTPVPEPQQTALLLIGLGALVFLTFRWRSNSPLRRDPLRCRRRPLLAASGRIVRQDAAGR
jgi:probable HAF family extracellular repeat protein